MKTQRPPRPRLAIDEVMGQIAARLPALTPHMFLDGDWVWYCGPSLAGADNKPVRETLKEIGFRFAINGHRMRDAQGNDTAIMGTWGHSCHHPTPPRRNIQRTGREADEQPASAVSSPSIDIALTL